MTTVTEADETTTNGIAEHIIIPSSENHCTSFDLLSNEDEQKLLEPGVSTRPGARPLIPQNRMSIEENKNSGVVAHGRTVPSLRSISLPKGPPQVHSNSSPAMPHACSTDNVSLPVGLPVIPEAKKSKKEVNHYYKKQNELLENFRNDSEQILVSSKARTRNRLQSSTSGDEQDRLDENDIPMVESNQQLAPLLKHVDSEDVEIQTPRPDLEGQLSSLSLGGKKKDSSMTRSHDSAMARHELAMAKEKASTKAASRLAMITLFVNISLMLAKAVASYLSGSLSIISSLVDSCVDITSGLVISISARMIKHRDPYLYPRGRTRLEPLSLIIISVVMGVASIQLIFDAFSRIFNAYKYEFATEDQRMRMDEPTLDVSWATVAIMVATVAVKFTLFLICQKYKHDPSIEVLAMDHRNDCLSNSVALACATLANQYWYYFDPIGAIIVSIYILSTWVSTGREHLSKLSGKSAKPEFINRIIKVCIDHDPRISHLDTVYVYHYGTRFLVEVHIVMDEHMTLRDAHDISESLQINIESLPEVERAFVHTDYEFEHQPQDEHKVV